MSVVPFSHCLFATIDNGKHITHHHYGITGSLIRFYDMLPLLLMYNRYQISSLPLKDSLPSSSFARRRSSISSYLIAHRITSVISHVPVIHHHRILLYLSNNDEVSSHTPTPLPRLPLQLPSLHKAPTPPSSTNNPSTRRSYAHHTANRRGLLEIDITGTSCVGGDTSRHGIASR